MSFNINAIEGPNLLKIRALERSEIGPFLRKRMDSKGPKNVLLTLILNSIKSSLNRILNLQ